MAAGPFGPGSIDEAGMELFGWWPPEEPAGADANAGLAKVPVCCQMDPQLQLGLHPGAHRDA